MAPNRIEVKKQPTNKLKELLSVVEETSGKMIIWANFTHDLLTIEEELTKLYGEDSCATFYGDDHGQCPGALHDARILRMQRDICQQRVVAVRHCRQ